MPAIAISLIAMFPTPATIAFGGVPTGMWNAKLHDIAAGNIRYSGWISIAIAISASTGRMTLQMATFEVNSVNVCAVKQTTNSSSKGGRVFKPDNELPSSSAIPDLRPPSASANPPPSRKIKLHGTFWLMNFHVISPGVASLGRRPGFLAQNLKHRQLAGIMKSTITMNIAGVASLILTSFRMSAQPVMKPGSRVKNNTTATTNRKATLFSCDDIGPSSL
uniref:Putative secreted protein n=1 Tax=Anopheles triannulatus TaxID=58253 RepID=A0A2M4B1E9_9DIPT